MKDWQKKLIVISFFVWTCFIVLIYVKDNFITAPAVNFRNDTVFISDTIRDTTLITRINYEPGLTQTIYVQVPERIDTIEVIQDYVNKHYYCDTLLNDSLAFIVVMDSVSQNKIYSRSFEYRNRRPIAINQTIITTGSSAFRFGAGAYIGGNSNSFSAGVIFSASKDKNVFISGYDFIEKKVKIGYIREF
jgi:hypothetical protein